MATRKGGPGRWGVGQNPGSLNDSPFKGSDPISQVAAYAWRIPGAIASGRKMNGQKVSPEEWSGLLATAALAGAGIYSMRSGGRTLPRTPGARPMTTAERSVAVTRAGRTGVGKIGPSIRPKAPDAFVDEYAPEPLSSYGQVYRKARTILDNRNTRAGRPGVRTPDTILDVTGNPKYKGNTWDNHGFNPWTDQYETQNLIPSYMKRTIDWRDARAPLRRTASVKRRTGM